MEVNLEQGLILNDVGRYLHLATIASCISGDDRMRSGSSSQTMPLAMGRIYNSKLYVRIRRSTVYTCIQYTFTEMRALQLEITYSPNYGNSLKGLHYMN